MAKGFTEFLASLFSVTDRDGDDQRALRAADDARKRLSLLVVPDEAVRSAAQRVVYASGKYLEGSAKGAPRDPRCEGALFEAVRIVDDYLKLLDASAAAERFGGSSRAGSLDRDADSSLEADAVSALDGAAREIEEALELNLGGEADDARGSGATVADRAAARKELP